MKTILGTEIPDTTRGILYLCHFDFLVDPPKLTVMREILCDSASDALNLYAEIPNPPSQLATGRTYEELCNELQILHRDMVNEEWLKELSEQI